MKTFRASPQATLIRALEAIKVTFPLNGSSHSRWKGPYKSRLVGNIKIPPFPTKKQSIY